MCCIRFYAFATVLLAAISTTGYAQTQPATRLEVSAFFKRGTVTNDFWGFDVSYNAGKNFGFFGTLTIVDTVGVSGWMADAGVRSRPFELWVLRAAIRGGLRVKHLRDVTQLSTQVRAVTESRLSLPLGNFSPYFAIRYPWFDFKDSDSVWGLAVAVW